MINLLVNSGIVDQAPLGVTLLGVKAQGSRSLKQGNVAPNLSPVIGFQSLSFLIGSGRVQD